MKSMSYIKNETVKITVRIPINEFNKLNELSLLISNGNLSDTVREILKTYLIKVGQL